MTRSSAIKLLEKYNSEAFHIQHALTVENTMRYFAEKLGYEDDVDFWGLVGLLHDVDYGQWPNEHLQKAPELLAEIDAPPDMVHAIVSHGYGICSTVEPEHMMEKILCYR